MSAKTQVSESRARVLSAGGWCPDDGHIYLYELRDGVRLPWAMRLVEVAALQLVWFAVIYLTFRPAVALSETVFPDPRPDRLIFALGLPFLAIWGVTLGARWVMGRYRLLSPAACKGVW